MFEVGDIVTYNGKDKAKCLNYWVHELRLGEIVNISGANTEDGDLAMVSFIETQGKGYASAGDERSCPLKYLEKVQPCNNDVYIDVLFDM